MHGRLTGVARKEVRDRRTAVAKLSQGHWGYESAKGKPELTTPRLPNPQGEKTAKLILMHVLGCSSVGEIGGAHALYHLDPSVELWSSVLSHTNISEKQLMSSKPVSFL